jgi:hypothetical protein
MHFAKAKSAEWREQRVLGAKDPKSAELGF